MPPPEGRKWEPSLLARVVSLIALVGVVGFLAFLFFRVVADFLFPMFIAVLLVVIFSPLHRRILAFCRGRSHLAAGISTLVILLVFLVPLLTILIQGSAEGFKIYHKLENPKEYFVTASQKAAEFGARFGFHLDPEELQATISTNFKDWLAPIALGTTQFVGNFLLGILVMAISLYFFLADGPGMVQNLVRWSPLDQRYSEQLVDQFAGVSRAVVLATLLSAVAQGLLSGVGYYFAGLQPVFLLIVLTMILSMVPFVGAVSVWVPACLWLYFAEERTTAAIALAIYGAIIVSTVDNIVKPVVLHGRSKLHPLLALLSVMGGIKALGPVGILVGPMIVAFLQTLLEMLHAELQEINRGGAARLRPTTAPPPDATT